MSEGEKFMADPISISLKQVSAAAKTSVGKALEQNKVRAPSPTVIGYFPPYHWLGIIVRPTVDPALADAQKLAADLHSAMATSVSAIEGGEPGAITGQGHLIIGFVLPPGIGVLEE
jgi:hypothetical protein